jgi:hypothetical protein
MQVHDSAGRRTLRLRTGAAALAVGLAGAGLVALAGAPAGAAVFASAPVRAGSALGVARGAGALRAATLGGPACGTTGTPRSIDLYATPGTITLAGQVNPVPVWRFTGTSAGDVNAGNPVLTACAGDTLTVTVHNDLPAAAGDLSLSVPGIAGFPLTVTPAAPGGTAVYPFTVSRPGSYLYQAGHTTNGARQVVMGLAGALVVRPNGFTPSASTNDDLDVTSPANAFADEAVLLLGDLDPKFNADPLNYDLRQFNPTYRMINGKVYPGTDPIPTAPGHNVLLRYLNAGVVSHSMGVGGLRQQVVALDSRPADGNALVADTIPPGETEDALVTVPGTGGNFPVYDQSGRLDTSGLTSGGLVGLGGMMTVLGSGVGAAPPDAGPTTAITGVTPNPTAINTDVTVTATFQDTDGDTVTDAELLVDGQASTTTPGGGLAFTLTGGGSGGTATIPWSSTTAGALTVASLSQGKHQLYVRAKDSAGFWGPVTAATLTVATTGPSTINVAVNPNPSNGAPTPGNPNPDGSVTLSGTADNSKLGDPVDQFRYTVDGGTPVVVTIGTPAPVVALSTTFSVTSPQPLAEGTHNITVASHDGTAGVWGPDATVTLTVDLTGPINVSGSVTPSPNNGTLASAVDPTSLQVLSRFTDVVGSVSSKLVGAEGFLQPADVSTQTDTCAGCVTGTGFVFVAGDGAWDSTTEDAYGLIPLSELTGYPTGTYHVWVHAQDAAGNWGTLTPYDLVIDKAGPVVAASPLAFTQTGVGAGTVTATATDALSAVAGGEAFVGPDPGAGNGQPLTAAAGSTPGVATQLTGTLTGLAVGTSSVSVRARDALGNWGQVRTFTATVLADPIFSDSFGTATTGNTGTAAAWTGGVTGGPTFPRITGFDGRFAMLTANGGINSNVTTPPVAPVAGSYKARFLFRPNNLSATGVDILSLRNGTGHVADVQFRTSGSSRQVRLVVGTTASGASPWYTLGTSGNTTYTLRLDWTAGTNATVRLAVNTNTTGAPVWRITLPGLDTSAQTVTSAVLGTSGGGVGNATTVSGRAYVDYYAANRFTIPQ